MLTNTSKSIEKLIERFSPDVKFVAGHGRDYSLNELKDIYRMAVSAIVF